MDHGAAILATLLRLEAKLDVLPSAFAVALAANRGAVTEEDRAILDILLKPLLQAVGETRFTLKMLDEQADIDDELRAAMSAVRRRGVSHRALGKMFARIEGADLGGAVVWQRSKKKREGALWQIVRV